MTSVTAPAPAHRLNDGHPLPAIGFGTYPHHGDDSQVTTAHALDAGYRLLDTALRYGNEEAVGRAVTASGVDRDDIVVTTKLPGRHHGYDEAIGSLHESLRNLRLERVELYLIHWPLPRIDRYVDTWRAMIALREQGLTRSIGVSNFTAEHLHRLIDETGVVPAVNQIEMHPYFPQAQLRAVHAELGIVTEAWSPLGRGGLLTEPAVREVGDAHGVSPAQAVLRWHLQLDTVPIPMSADAQRQRQNLDVGGFTLSVTRSRGCPRWRRAGSPVRTRTRGRSSDRTGVATVHDRTAMSGVSRRRSSPERAADRSITVTVLHPDGGGPVLSAAVVMAARAAWAANDGSGTTRPRSSWPRRACAGSTCSHSRCAERPVAAASLPTTARVRSSVAGRCTTSVGASDQAASSTAQRCQRCTSGRYQA